ncbi:hypothetical protein HK405_013355, partial [Cladochytrium tenue]
MAPGSSSAGVGARYRSGANFVVAALALDWLYPREQFLVATLLRLRHAQAAALARLPHAAMDVASAAGRVDLLEFRCRFTTRPHLLAHSHAAMDAASHAGHVSVLDWWRANATVEDDDDRGPTAAAATDADNSGPGEGGDRCGLRLQWSCGALDGASGNGRVEVLDWWAASGLQLKWSALAMDLASGNGH